jgi:hypothetical protein
MRTKICKKCNSEKDICEFGKNGRNRDNLQSICKNCDNIRSKKYKEKNREKYLLSQKEYYKRHKISRSISSKEYYKENQKTIIDKNKKYYYGNIESVKLTKKKYRNKNKEKLNKQSREYSYKNRKSLSEKEKERRMTDDLFRTIRYVRNRINQYLKSKNYKKDSQSFQLVGCSPEFFKSHIEELFTEGMSWSLMGNSIHIDHIIPLSSGKTIDEVKKLCHYTNLQPLWSKDNLKKGKKIIN